VEEQEAGPGPGRAREEESPWVTVARKPRKTTVGKSNVDLAAMGLAAEAGPVEIYVSNTANTTEKESIMKVLETTASKIEDTAGFKVINAELLTKDLNPRTKCWKVTVPYKFRDLMENDELYPAGWRYRKFFASRNFRKLPEGGRRQGGQQGLAVTAGAGAAEASRASAAAPVGARRQEPEAREEVQVLDQDVTRAVQEARQEVVQPLAGRSEEGAQ
jgi:hypothetical protein